MAVTLSGTIIALWLALLESFTALTWQNGMLGKILVYYLLTNIFCRQKWAFNTFEYLFYARNMRYGSDGGFCRANCSIYADLLEWIKFYWFHFLFEWVYFTIFILFSILLNYGKRKCFEKKVEWTLKEFLKTAYLTRNKFLLRQLSILWTQILIKTREYSHGRKSEMKL